MLTGTLTLDPLTLPESCNAVYLLDQADIPVDGTCVYEATLDGATWVAVTVGAVTALGHSGSALAARVTLTLPDDSGNTGTITWFVFYATTA